MAKGPKDDDDPTRLRWFAKRIADMKWWGENSKPAEPAKARDQGEQAASQERQVTSEDSATVNGGTNSNRRRMRNLHPKRRPRNQPLYAAR